VRTKEELLAALADRFFNEVELPTGDDGPWDEQLAQVFRSVRRVFLGHPELIPIVATQRLEGIAAYRGAEAVFAALRRAGLGDQEVVNAFDGLTAFTIGSVQRETGMRTRGTGLLPGIRELPPQEFGHVISLAGPLVTRDPERGFEAGLDLLIRGLRSQAGV
jgi:hypothetical protein